MHHKRQGISRLWPIPRKGTAYVVKATFNPERGVPILVALRDMLSFAENKREVRQAIHKGLVLLNNKPIKHERQGVMFYDVLTIVPTQTHYRLVLSEKGRFTFLEETKAQATKKAIKIIGKKTLKGKKTQINLLDGRNFLTTNKYTVNDSAVLDFATQKEGSALALKEKATIIVFSGKHIGKRGTIQKVVPEHNNVHVKDEHGYLFDALIKQVMVIQ